MRHILFASVLVSVLGLPLAAQSGGRANQSTPTVGQSIAFTNGCSVQLDYRAITWAQGQWMKALENEAGRTRTNNDLKKNPTGTLNASADITLGGQTVKAGKYKLYFQVDDEVKFHLVLADESGNETKWKLDLQDTKDNSSRLSLTITAGKAATDANVGIAFGSMACTVAMTATATKTGAKDAASGKDGK